MGQCAVSSIPDYKTNLTVTEPIPDAAGARAYYDVKTNLQNYERWIKGRQQTDCINVGTKPKNSEDVIYTQGCDAVTGKQLDFDPGLKYPSSSTILS